MAEQSYTLSNPPENIYKDFRKTSFPGDLGYFPNISEYTSGPLTKKFDEPTYLTFRVEFYAENEDNKLNQTNFDKVPQPLFFYDLEDDINARNYYSSHQYLRDMNEIVRSKMLTEFIQKWNNLQSGYQWYFQSVTGLESLLNVSPKRGRRVGDDARITFTMLEAIDQRTTYLLNLYKKTAWDDVYQRWILPDIMRYFRARIYITEFRTFHQSQYVSNLDRNQPIQQFNENITSDIAADIAEQGLKRGRARREQSRQEEARLMQTSPTKGNELMLETIYNMNPTYVLELERCEFDIESIRPLPDSVTVADAEMREVEFSIKVGNFSERYINPIFSTFLHDTLINGYDRAEEFGVEGNMASSIFIGGYNRSGALLTETIMAQNNEGTQSGANVANHLSSAPYLQHANRKSLFGVEGKANEGEYAAVNPIDPATWVGNALTAGKALAKNFIESKVDEVKVKKIPGLGISFNEALAALQSKNVFTLFGAARKAIQDNVEGSLPSSELEENFVDTQLRNMLVGITQSEATDDDAIRLQEAANTALNDEGQWEKIKDLSKATDLLSTALKEINIPMEIENPTALKEYYKQGADIPVVGIEDGIVIEGLPSSTATQDNPLEGEKLNQPLPGQATLGGGVEQIESYQSTELGSTEGTLPKGSTVPASSELGNAAGESLSQPSDGLGDNATGGLSTVIPSEQLGSSAGEGVEQPGDGLGSNATGGLETVKPSSQLGSAVEGKGLEQPESGEAVDGDKIQAGALRGDPRRLNIEGNKIPQPEPGEAVDGDPLEGEPLTRPKPSQATNNELDK